MCSTVIMAKKIQNVFSSNVSLSRIVRCGLLTRLENCIDVRRRTVCREFYTHVRVSVAEFIAYFVSDRFELLLHYS